MTETRMRHRGSVVSVLVLCGMLAVSVWQASAAALLEVTPDFFGVTGFAGDAGGPFSPSFITYTVINRDPGQSLSWCAGKSAPWVTVTPECGVLAPGASAPVRVSVDDDIARTLPVDGYSDRLVFTNLTNNRVITPDGSAGTATARRYVTLNVRGDDTSAVQGFGATTRGGADGTVFRVTTLADNGDDGNPLPGSLRDAVSQRNRHIVFDVAGTIALQTHLYVQGDHITIDGSSAPAPGITLTRYGIVLRGNRGVHDVVVRDLRVRDLVRHPGSEQWDGIQIAYGAFNILVDHVSVQDADDGNIDITNDAHDVTVAWSIIARPRSGKNMLVKYHASRITLHHNLFLSSDTRHPQIDNDDAWTLATDTTVDFRNNLIWDFGSIATRVSKGSRVNVVGNYYSKAPFALVVNSLARAYTRGNVVHNSSVDLDLLGTELVPFPGPPVDTTDAARAASDVMGGAGARPLDAVDQALLAAIPLTGTSQPPSIAVSVLKSGGGTGTVVSAPGAIDCGTHCTALVAEGTSLTLTATPAAGSTFLGFSGSPGCAGGQLAVSAAVTCVATFETSPDLVVSALKGPIGVVPGGVVPVQHTTQNRAGTGPAGPTTTLFYLSRNTTIGAGDALLASVEIGALAPGESRVTTTDLVVPLGTPPGIYNVVAQADGLGNAAETSEINNMRSVRIVVGADVSIASLVAPTAAAPGASIAVTVVTANAPAVGPAPGSVTRVYLSRDTAPGPGEAIAEHTVGILDPARRDTWTSTITLPTSLVPGRYYLIAGADDDDVVVETRETNNRRIRSITIRP
jgi:pectate lyase